jgi:glycosyltransferase involved in cell wall biosynthesis
MTVPAVNHNQVANPIPTAGNSGKLPFSAIILTYNEEKNIEDCLRSVAGLAEDIYVVDSFSTDATLTIAGKYPVTIVQHTFENYSLQRNWALQNLPLRTEWVLQLDADHRLSPELQQELIDTFAVPVPEAIKGFMASRRTIFMGKWIKYGGHYPVYHAFLFRRGYGCCEDRIYDQHFVVNGETRLLRGDILDIITDSLTNFTSRHNKWATLEAEEAMQMRQSEKKENSVIQPNRYGNPIEQRRWLRMKYYSYPLFWRAGMYFMYRYFIKRGFMDGREGMVFHFLQGFWFRFLVDAKIYEAIRNRNK